MIATLILAVAVTAAAPVSAEPTTEYFILVARRPAW